MSHISDDLRVRRTQKLIREALIALIEEQSFDAITVGEIASRAMVSRTAFYRYYEDKYDLVIRIFEEMITLMNQEFDTFRHDALRTMKPRITGKTWGQIFAYSEEVLPPYVALFEHVVQYERLYLALLGKKGSPWFVTNLRAYLARMVQERLRDLLKGLTGQERIASRVIEDGFVPAQIAALLVDTIIWWLEQERPYSPTKIATYYYRMMCAILKDVPTWE
jgi:AcrR family transcriptional regulator